MGWLDRLLAAVSLRSPADRRMEAAMAKAFAAAPQPARPPFTTHTQPASGYGSGRPIDWTQDQPVPPPPYNYAAGYDDHLFRSFATPVNYEGFTLAAIRSAVAQHRLGIFYNSWALSVALMGFAPILAALQQAVAPILDLDRRIKGGPRGLSRGLADELREDILPAASLVPSPYFPPTLLATSIISQRMMGFSVLQHVDGDPDPVTGVRPRFTRIWPAWATQCNPSPLKWLALTTDGVVEIGVDSHFTLVADQERPHLMGALVALGEEGFAGKLAQNSRNQWIERNGQIKWIATLPDKVPTHGAEGDDFLAAVAGLSAPDGLGIFPFGSKFESVALTRDTSGAFNDALSSIIAHVGMVLVGSPGPIISGAEGVYQAGTGGKWNVRQDLVDEPTIAFCRAFNLGHVVPWCEGNYSVEIAGARRAGTWVQPAFEILLDDPEANARIDAVAKREIVRCEILDARRESGIVVTQEDADALADTLDVPKVLLATTAATPAARLDIAPTDLAKVITVDEARASRQLPPLGGARGAMMIAELDASTKPGPFGRPAEGGEGEPPPDGNAPPPANDKPPPPPEETPAP